MSLESLLLACILLLNIVPLVYSSVKYTEETSNSVPKLRKVKTSSRWSKLPKVDVYSGATPSLTLFPSRSERTAEQEYRINTREIQVLDSQNTVTFIMIKYSTSAAHTSQLVTIR